jgi:FkbM family methyltransferase
LVTSRKIFFGGGGFKLFKSEVGVNGQSIWLIHDRVIAPYINKCGFWDIELSNYISQHINSLKGMNVFIDIGANQGLISMQVANKLSQLSNTEFVCVEPVREFYSNLKKNIEQINNISYDLHNFGLGSVSNSNAFTYISKRNATSSQYLSIVLAYKKIEKIGIVSVNEFIKNYLVNKTYDNLVVKSDTDGNDIEIFNSFMNANVDVKISCYILEVIVKDTSEYALDKLKTNIYRFSDVLLVKRNNEKIKNKDKIISLIKNGQGHIGDLFLTNQPFELGRLK